MSAPLDRSEVPPKLDLASTLRAVDALLGHEQLPPHAPGVRERLHALIADMARDGHRRSDPIREVFARLGDRWSVLLILLLRTSDFRHAMLRRLVSALAAEGEISQRMLTLRLRELERDGLICRRTLPTNPPGVVYALSAAGHGLAAQIDALMNWTREHSAAILTAQRRYGEVAGAGAGDGDGVGDGDADGDEE
jgi:DNA-binding HxlR family transcriptional regulator